MALPAVALPDGIDHVATTLNARLDVRLLLALLGGRSREECGEQQQRSPDSAANFIGVTQPGDLSTAHSKSLPRQMYSTSVAALAAEQPPTSKSRPAIVSTIRSAFACLVVMARPPI